MRHITKQFNREKAYTLVELLTVMSIIIILIGMFAPTIVQIRQFARDLKQKNRFRNIGTALEQFNADRANVGVEEYYPPSNDDAASNPPGEPYCGAMKLAEAMLGQDLLGFNLSSVFRADGTIDGTVATQLYQGGNLKFRKGPYLPTDYVHELDDIYPTKHLTQGVYNLWQSLVLCDVYGRVTNLGGGKKSKIGMPILYYKANTSNVIFDANAIDPADNIYNHMDNHLLVALGIPWQAEPPTFEHPLFSNNGREFYMSVLDEKITVTKRPRNPESYILLSAGNDGEYGTSDDVFNFE